MEKDLTKIMKNNKIDKTIERGIKMNNDLQDVLKFLQDSKVFYLATVDGDKPKVRPISLVFEYENRLYFSTVDFKPSYNQLLANKNLEISVANNNQWIRISGKAVFDEREEIYSFAFEKNPFLKKLYGGSSHKFYYIVEGEASFCSRGTEPKIVKF